MKLNKKATSIVESMIVMLIIVTWVIWMYNIYIKSTQLTQSVESKIKAIHIATQWIEAFTNIRDTNWLRFSSDYANCWNTLNYNSACIWASDNLHMIGSWSYKIYSTNNNKWYLSELSSNTFWSGTYISDFQVWLNSKWIYNQTWSLNNLKPIYTRELKISYLQADWTNIWTSSDPKIKIISIVQWVDRISTKPHKIEIEQILSNWKK